MQSRAPILGIELEAPSQVRLALGPIGAILEVHLGDRSEQAGPHLRIRRGFRLLQIARRDRLPVGLNQRHLRQALGRGTVVGDVLQRLAQTRLRRFLAQQFVGENATLFVKQVRAPGLVRRPRQFQIDQLNAKFEVAPLTMPPTGVRQRARQDHRIDPCPVAWSQPFERAQRVGIGGIDLQGRECCRNICFHWDLASGPRL